MNWKYGRLDFTEAPKGFVGFIYEISFDDGTRYIGKKNFFSNRKRNFGKKELALITDKRLKKYEIITKESDWRDYASSNSLVKRKIKNGDGYKKDILSFARTKKHLTYLEESTLYNNHVLWDDLYLNDNIAGRFFTKDIVEWESKKS